MADATPPTAAPRRLSLAILVISAVGIAYQIALMRIFAIAQWHHFAYMIISIAMLGFGASGTALALLRNRLRGREAPCLRTAAALLALSMPGCYVLSQRVPFETFELVSQPGQVWHLLTLYVILSVPFFLVSTCITLAFFLRPNQVARTYFFNMAGSGLGALVVAGLLYLAAPAALPYLCMAAVGAALLLLVPDTKPYPWCVAAVVVAAAGILGALRPASIRVSQYKGLSYAQQLPDAKILGEWYSPLSVVTALASEQIRETPGQISNYPMQELGALPEQIGLYFDAGGVSPVHQFDGHLDRFAFLDYVTSALPSRLVESPKVLVIGPGGGTDVLSALYHDARHVDAVEVEPNVYRILRTELADFSGGLYDRDDVTAIVGEGRGYLASHDVQYDLIQIPSMGSFTASSAGVHALSESYFHTTEAARLFLESLAPDGVLAVSLWLKTPARDALKMFATLVEACEQLGIEDPGQHLAFIRSWNNATIIATRQPMDPGRVEAVRAFCQERMLDLCYCPGIRPDEPNQYTLLDEPVYYDFATRVLASETRDALYDEALFYVRPADDNRPYFFRFLKWSSLPRLIEDLGTEWIPYVEWGYLTLVGTIVQGFVASVVLILLPLIALARQRGRGHAKGWTFVYFAALGVAYMFLEMVFIQRFMLFLAYPIYAVAVVLTAFLLFSGLGSLAASRSRLSPLRTAGSAVAVIAVLAGGYIAGLPLVFDACAGWPDAAKILVSLVLLAPLAFHMGKPFPVGLQMVSTRHEALLPWAWGINGCASVTGTTLATLTAIHAGFRVVMLIAVAAYLIAVFALRGLDRAGVGGSA